MKHYETYSEIVHVYIILLGHITAKVVKIITQAMAVEPELLSEVSSDFGPDSQAARSAAPTDHNILTNPSTDE